MQQDTKMKRIMFITFQVQHLVEIIFVVRQSDKIVSDIRIRNILADRNPSSIHSATLAGILQDGYLLSEMQNW